MTRQAAVPRPRRAGFTLVELLVVLAVVGTLSVVVLPSWAESATGAAAAVRDVAALHDAARELAVTRAVPVRLTLDLSSGAHVLLAQDPSGVWERRGGRLEARGGVRLWSGDDRRLVAVFSPLGSARAADVVVRDGRRSYRVVVDPWTGTATVRRER